ncbi:hypothetical protein MMC10_009615 [Thelotrema lepadinum]|nr:hypothetical protein [Thelotrema lepadinum]
MATGIRLAHLYRRRADIVGSAHGVPGVGSLRRYLTPPGWEVGQDPINPQRAEELYEESRDRAADILDQEVQDDAGYQGRALEDRQSLREEAHRNSRMFDEVILRERIAVYYEWDATAHPASPYPENPRPRPPPPPPPSNRSNLNGPLSSTTNGNIASLGVQSGQGQTQGGATQSNEREGRRQVGVPRSIPAAEEQVSVNGRERERRQSDTITIDSDQTISFESHYPISSPSLMGNNASEEQDGPAGRADRPSLATQQSPIRQPAPSNSSQPPVFQFGSRSQRSAPPARRMAENLFSSAVRIDNNPPFPSRTLPPVPASVDPNDLPRLGNFYRGGPSYIQWRASGNESSPVQNAPVQRPI